MPVFVQNLDLLRALLWMDLFFYIPSQEICLELYNHLQTHWIISEWLLCMPKSFRTDTTSFVQNFPCLLHSHNISNPSVYVSRIPSPYIVKFSSEGIVYVAYKDGLICNFTMNGRSLTHKRIEDGIKVNGQDQCISHNLRCAKLSLSVQSLKIQIDLEYFCQIEYSNHRILQYSSVMRLNISMGCIVAEFFYSG